MKIYDVVSSFISDGNKFLLVKLKPPEVRRTEAEKALTYFWTIPGGKIEPGESVQTAMKREILEETGLTVPDIGKPIATITYESSEESWQCNITLFHALHLHTESICNDPDEDVLEVKWFDLTEALVLLKQIPWAPMREPILHYLEHGIREMPWHYQLQQDGSYLLL